MVNLFQKIKKKLTSTFEKIIRNYVSDACQSTTQEYGKYISGIQPPMSDSGIKNHSLHIMCFGYFHIKEDVDYKIIDKIEKKWETEIKTNYSNLEKQIEKNKCKCVRTEFLCSNNPPEPEEYRFFKFHVYIK